jgi:hypothetical protein
MSEQQHKVGDELAFSGLSSGWKIYKIDKITPSGRIKCGPYELNPDLTVRGRHTWSTGPRRAYPATEEFRTELLRSKLLHRLEHKTDWESLTTEQLKAILAIVKQAGG